MLSGHMCSGICALTICTQKQGAASSADDCERSAEQPDGARWNNIRGREVEEAERQARLLRTAYLIAPICQILSSGL